MAQDQFLEQLLGTVIPQQNFSEGGVVPGAPFAQPPHESQAAPLSDIELLIQSAQSQAPKPLTRGEKAGGAIAAAIQGFLDAKLRRAPTPTAVTKMLERNQAEADRANQERLRRAQVELRDRAEETRQRERGEDIERRGEESDLAFDRRLELLRLETDEQKRRELVEAGENKLMREHRENLQRMSQQFDPTLTRQFAKEQREGLQQVMGDVVATKQQLDGLLKTNSPQQLREDFMTKLSIVGLEGETRQRAILFFEQQLGAALDRASQPSRPTGPQAVLESAGGLPPLLSAGAAGASVLGNIMDAFRANEQIPLEADVLGPLSTAQPDVLPRLSK